MPAASASWIASTISPGVRRSTAAHAAQIYDAGDAGAWLATSNQSPGNGGVLQLVFGEGGSVTDFEVVRYAGCYFVKF